MSGAAADGGLAHLARLYDGPADYTDAVREFVHAALARGEPVLVAVPQPRASLLGPELPQAGGVTVADITELGRNPARMIPAVRAFVDAHAGQRVRYVSEVTWPERSAAGLREAARHEALVNLAFAAARATIMCLFDATRLPGAVLADAAMTHPVLVRDGHQQPSASFLQPPAVPPDCDLPFPPPPAQAAALSYERDLRPVRALVAQAARGAGLPADRVTDLVIAVNEVAANTLRHTAAGGTLQLWHTDAELICQVHDSGVIADPLAGRRLPVRELPGGKGLWLVNQLCDLVEMRTSPAGTTIRLHLGLG